MKNFITADFHDYTEIMQSVDLHYALAYETPKDIIQTHHWIKCRDFFNEALIASKLGLEESPRVWGFSYPSGEYPIDLSETRLLLKGSNWTNLLKNLSLLNDYEESISQELTTIEKIDGTDYLYCRSSSNWLISPTTLSFFTYILRCLYAYDYDAEDLISYLRDVEKLGIGNDKQYQKDINKIDFDLFIRNMREIFLSDLPFKKMKDLDDTAYTIHDHTGIVSWSKTVSSNFDYMEGTYQNAVNRFKEIIKINNEATGYSKTG